MAIEADNPDTRPMTGARPVGRVLDRHDGQVSDRTLARSIAYKGELRKLFGGIAIPNATALPPTTRGRFADTVTLAHAGVDPATDGPRVSLRSISISARITSVPMGR